VVDYDYDKDFIIVLQQPNYEAFRISIAFDLRDDLKKYPTNSYDEITQSEKVADSLIKNNPYYIKIFSHKNNYWIIEHSNKKVYGPFTKEEYL